MIFILGAIYQPNDFLQVANMIGTGLRAHLTAAVTRLQPRFQMFMRTTAVLRAAVANASIDGGIEIIW